MRNTTPVSKSGIHTERLIDGATVKVFRHRKETHLERYRRKYGNR